MIQLPYGSDREIAVRVLQMLATVRDGEHIEQAAFSDIVCSALEWSIPDLLSDHDRGGEWGSEILDGVLPIRATRLGEDEVEIFAVAILMSDQTASLVCVQLQVDPSRKVVNWIDVRLGERIKGRWIREPYNTHKIIGRLSLNEWDARRINWCFAAKIGTRR